jgi:hypothetical protein
VLLEGRHVAVADVDLRLALLHELVEELECAVADAAGPGRVVDVDEPDAHS